MICNTCNEPCDSLRSIIVGKTILNGCDNCLESHLQQAHEGQAKHNREYQKKQYRKELTQPNQGRDFVRAYGADKAREHGYGEELIRKLH